MKVLITTSGTGSRLGAITKNRNKSLVKVGEKPAISHIIDSLLENSQHTKFEFIITLGHFGDQVKQLLTYAYPNEKFTFVNVEPFEGAGSSLLFSMSCAKQHLQEPFIFHTCDMLPKSPSSYTELLNLTKEKKNLFVSFKDHNSTQCRYIHKRLFSYSFSKSSSEIGSYAGISYVHDFSSFWKQLEFILSRGQTQDKSDCDIYNKMGLTTLNSKTINGSFRDISNTDSLSRVQDSYEDIPTLGEKGEDVFLINGKAIKFFSDEASAKQAHQRVRNISLAPETSHFGNYLCYNFIEGETLRKKLTNSQDSPIFEYFLEYLAKNFYTIRQDWPVEADYILKDFFIKRTNEKIKAAEAKFNSKFANEEIIEINGKNHKYISQINQAVFKKAKFLSAYHGNLTLDNVIVDKNLKFFLIDWRKDMGERNFIYGDIRYDIAKLYHSLIINHLMMKNNQFNFNPSYNSIMVDTDMPFSCSQNLKSLLDFSNKEFRFEEKEIKRLVGLIWLSMSADHEENKGKFFFWIGQKMLGENLD